MRGLLYRQVSTPSDAPSRLHEVKAEIFVPPVLLDIDEAKDAIVCTLNILMPMKAKRRGLYYPYCSILRDLVRE